jgi:hypothetical protein
MGVSGWSTPRPGSLTPGKEPRYALYRGLGGPQGRSGRGMERRRSLPAIEVRTPDHLVCSVVAIATTLSRPHLYVYVM